MIIGKSENGYCTASESFATATSNKNNGLAEVAKAAIELKGKGQKAPFIQKDINLQDKEQVNLEDRRRFSFVNDIVKEVETRKVLSNESTSH